MANILSAQITADGSKFTKTLGQLQAQLKSFENGLKNAGSVESFNRLNRAIDATKNRITALNGVQGQFSRSSDQSTQALINLSRVAQDAPYGFIGIANNLNPLLESFQRLKSSTGSTGTAFKALGAALTGPAGIGLALGVASSLLVTFGDKLFGAAAASKASEDALKSYGDEIDNVKEKVDGLADSLQFLNQLGSINIKISGLGDVLDLQGQAVSQRQFTQDLLDSQQRLRDERQKIFQDENLNEKDRAKALEDNNKAILELDKKLTESRQAQSIIQRRIALQRVEDQKDANKKAQEDYDKYVRDTIAKAKQLADFLDKFTNRSFSFEVDPRDTLGETFTRAKEFIEKAINQQRSFNFKLDARIEFEKIVLPNIEEDAKKTRDAFEKAIQAEFSKAPLQIQVNTSMQEGANRSQEFFNALGLPELGANFKSFLLPFQKDIINTANLVNATLTPAFDSFFDALLEGENPIQGFFEGLRRAIGSFVKEIGTAIIKALLLQAIFKAFNFGGGGVGDIFKGLLGFRAAGGPVNAGGSYVVGEKGPELFVPNTGGRIVSNADINRGGMGSLQTQPVQVGGQVRVSGNDLILVLANANRSQGRLL